jgi:two-component system response regulator MprA
MVVELHRPLRAGTLVKTILIADDDPSIINMLRRTLAYEGFATITATSGQETLDQARNHSPDLIVLDWRMPEHDGIEVLRRIRAADPIPILMLTARDAVADRIVGLDSGADDYLVKPFDGDELLARIRALLRRIEPEDSERQVAYSNIVIDPVSCRTYRAGREILLTRTEFNLLAYLVRHAERVMTRTQILDAVWGDDYFGEENIIEVYVRYLRVKTEAGGEPRLLQTVRSVGYVVREE